ncbi:MAG: hypothetical protein Unbinned834contig1000_51 [Prokaryotic dsDNA virus sp.]|nr:MAG: hypothetical protein Unbinned834contig1000_51 [Prokaryotic dsDNA virus sp.]
MENQQLIQKECQGLVGQLHLININILKDRLRRGAILEQIKEKKLYVNYDSYVETWEQFLECIQLNRETARQDMQIYYEFADYLFKEEHLMGTSYERLVRLLPLVRKEPLQKEALLHMARDANRPDFENNLRELKGKMPTDKCEDCTDTPIILKKCRVCGKIYKE